MSSRTSTIVFRILLALLTVEAVYVAITMMLPPDTPPYHAAPNDIAIAVASPTPFSTPTPFPSPTPLPSPAQTPSPTPTRSAEPTPAPTSTPAPTPSANPSPTPTDTPTPRPSPTPLPSPTSTPRPRPTPTKAPAKRIAIAPAAVPSKMIFAGPDAFSFDGRWERIRGHFDGRPGGTSSRSFHPGDLATLTFSGRFVRLYGVVGPGGGTGLVEIDGGRLRRVVSFAAAAKDPDALVFTSPPLNGKRHRLSVAVLAPTARASGRFVNIVGANYGG